MLAEDTTPGFETAFLFSTEKSLICP